MARSSLYFKVEIEHGENENIEKLASEVQRQIRRVYGVERVELSNVIPVED